MITITGLIAFALYLVSTLGLFLRLRGDSFFSRKPIATILLPGFVAVLLHALVLYKQLVGISGFQIGFFDAASSVTIVIS